jgi:hypothetical protein
VGKLADTLLKPETRPNLIRDCVVMVDDEINSKGGLSGMAIKTGYVAVKTFKASIITEAIEGMIDDMVKNLEPFWDEYEKGGKSGSFDSFVNGRAPAVADALLKISDDRAATTHHQTLKKVYEKLRPTGKKNVEQAVPRVGKVVSKFMASA